MTIEINYILYVVVYLLMGFGLVSASIREEEKDAFPMLWFWVIIIFWWVWLQCH